MIDISDQEFKRGYTSGFNEAAKYYCEVKQENERLKRENALLRTRLESIGRNDDINGEYE